MSRRCVTVAIEQRWLHSSLVRFAASIGFLAVNPLRTFAAGNGYYNHGDNLANFSLKWKKIVAELLPLSSEYQQGENQALCSLL